MSVREFSRAGVEGVTAAAIPAGRFRDLFFGAVDLGAIDRCGFLAVLRLRLPRAVPRIDSIHADLVAAELALVSSGMTMPFS